MFNAALKKLVDRFSGKSQEPPQKEIYVTAFGKHPGWNDHIDTISPQTDLQADFKRILYVHGIQSNIESGAWDKIRSQGNQLVEFNHTFLGFFPPCYLIGKLWSSTDGKGRSLYPMVVCLQSMNLPLPWILQQGLHELDWVKEGCIKTSSAARVREVIKQAETRLRVSAQNIPIQSGVNLPAAGVFQRLAALKEMGPDAEGLYRVLYFLDKEVIRFMPPGQTSRTGKSVDIQIHSKLLRIPVQSLTIREAFELWTVLLQKDLQVDIPLTMIFASEYSWMDIIVGEPTALQVYCLRAHIDTIPLTSSIPFTLDPSFIEGIQKRLNIDVQKKF